MSSAALAVPAAAPRRAWGADLPVLAVAVVWGGSYLAAKGITTAHTVIAVLVLRFGVVLPVLAGAGWRRLRALSARQLRGGALLGLVLGAIFILETYGVVHTSATNAGLIISLTMIFTPSPRRPSAAPGLPPRSSEPPPSPSPESCSSPRAAGSPSPARATCSSSAPPSPVPSTCC
ncbi:hypothetical protein GCM10020254_21760 [Streptomyces goshikiensis]